MPCNKVTSVRGLAVYLVLRSLERLTLLFDGMEMRDSSGKAMVRKPFLSVLICAPSFKMLPSASVPAVPSAAL